MSGEDPPENLSADQMSVLVGGFLMLNIKELNFNKKIRGKKSLRNAGLIPEKLTKRDCVSIVSEVFDIFGFVAPLLGGIKLDISVLHQRHVVKYIWIANFNLIKEIGNLKFRRAVIPIDAVSLDVLTFDTADATENLICSAIYARCKRVMSVDFRAHKNHSRSYGSPRRIGGSTFKCEYRPYSTHTPQRNTQKGMEIYY